MAQASRNSAVDFVRKLHSEWLRLIPVMVVVVSIAELHQTIASHVGHLATIY